MVVAYAMVAPSSIKMINMKLLKTLLPLFTLLMLLACSKDENDAKLPGIAENKNKNLTSVYPEAARLEFPKLKGGQSLVLVHRTNDKYGVNFCTEWDTHKKSQRWSCYQMHDGNYGGNVGRYQEGSLNPSVRPPSLPVSRLLSPSAMISTVLTRYHVPYPMV